MRKKLLALLMCATMVLGTGVTAFADTASDAKKLWGDNYDKFYAELYPEIDTIVDKAYNGSNGTVEYGYVDDASTVMGQYTPVVVYKAADTLNGTVKGEYYAATKVLGNYKATEANNETVAVAAKRVIDAAAPGVDGNYAVEVTDDQGSAKQVVVIAVTSGEGADTVTSTEGFVSNTKNYVKAPVVGTTLLTGSEDILNSTDADAYGKIYANISKGDLSGDLDAVVSAIDNKVFSKNAVAVDIDAYLQGTLATYDLGLEKQNIYGGNAKLLYNVDKLQAGTYTFDSDLITRTGFKDATAVNVFQPTLAATKFDTEAGSLVKDFVKVATVEVGSTITFDNSASYVDGVFVFDKGALEETTTTEAETTTTANAGISDSNVSPKTGDATPIAALAVVMMGACGAMVVASKKRA